MLQGIFIILLSFLGMEFIAWFTHKYIMHGLMWYLHKDHHDHSNTTIFEKNDLFFLIFAVPSWLGMMFGAMNGFDFKFYIGLGTSKREVIEETGVSQVLEQGPTRVITIRNPLFSRSILPEYMNSRTRVKRILEPENMVC